MSEPTDKKDRRLAFLILMLILLLILNVIQEVQVAQRVDAQERQIQILMANQAELAKAHGYDLASWKNMLDCLETTQKEIMVLDHRMRAKK